MIGMQFGSFLVVLIAALIAALLLHYRGPLSMSSRL